MKEKKSKEKPFVNGSGGTFLSKVKIPDAELTAWSKTTMINIETDAALPKHTGQMSFRPLTKLQRTDCDQINETSVECL